MFDAKELSRKSILITGATGLLGSNIVKNLLECKEKCGVSIHIIVLVRDEVRARKMFESNVEYLVGNVTEPIIYKGNVDYIIHSASNTDSKAFVETPVEVIHTTYMGTYQILRFAQGKRVRGVVFLSTMEIYGYPQTDDKVSEEDFYPLNPFVVRSAYPEGKQLAETLCKSFVEEYQVPVKVARLTQTFGPGVQYNDGRVFAEFARCVIENRDIILKTKGETKRSYLYTEDAVSAILTILLKGKAGEAYNVANEDTYCSIYDMAKLVATRVASGKIKVIIQEQDITCLGYAPVLKLNLDTSKLRELGWEANVNLVEMYVQLIAYMKKNK